MGRPSPVRRATPRRRSWRRSQPWSHGAPDPAEISTSYIERQDLTVRMACRRFTRLTNGFSKKLENLKAALALHFAWHNLVRIHRSLRITPAMAAGVTERVWDLSELPA